MDPTFTRTIDLSIAPIFMGCERQGRETKYKSRCKLSFRIPVDTEEVREYVRENLNYKAKHLVEKYGGQTDPEGVIFRDLDGQLRGEIFLSLSSPHPF